MLIDTGASCSVIDRRLADELKLEVMPTRAPITVHGSSLLLTSELVRDIRLGPITTSRTCLTADIPSVESTLSSGCTCCTAALESPYIHTRSSLGTWRFTFPFRNTHPS